MPIKDITISVKIKGLLKVQVFLWLLILMQPFLSADTVTKAARNFILNNLKAQVINRV